MYGARFGWLPGHGFGPGWGPGRGWCWSAGMPGFLRPRGWCWYNYFANEKEYLEFEKGALEKYLETIKRRLEELEKEGN